MKKEPDFIFCSNCEVGYHFININYTDVTCAKNYLENCNEKNKNGLYWIACMEGTLLLPSGKCQEIKGCI